MIGSSVRLCPKNPKATFSGMVGTVLREYTYERSQGRDKPPVKEQWVQVAIPDSDHRLRFWKSTRVDVLRDEVEVIGP